MIKLHIKLNRKKHKELKKKRGKKWRLIAENNTIQQTRINTVSKWNIYFPYPSVASLRMLIFRAKHNGFDTVVKKVGKRNYISVSDFNTWIERQTNKAFKKDIM